MVLERSRDLAVKIGPYDILSELGRGGMGVVFRVRGPQGNEAALKLLGNVDPFAIVRFEREKRLLALLGEEHGFVPLLDAGTAGRGAWLVMPLVPGGTLRSRLAGGPLGVEETVALGQRLAAALGAAHERGIIHRDVKPENVLFTQGGVPLVSDLGLAKHFDTNARGGSQSVRLTVDGAAKGTVGYMAPEQVEDFATVGPTADVFSLGAVLYECLTGRPAFEGKNVLELLTKVASGTVEPIGPAVPQWLEEVVLRALAHDPSRRFPDGGSLARALRVSVKKPAARRARLVMAVLALGLAGGIALAVEARRDSAKELLERGRGKRRAGDLDGAIQDLTRAIGLAPGLAAAWDERSVARYGKGEFDRALDDAAKAIELEPDFALAWGSRGAARCAKGDLDGAIADETRALDLDPGLAFAWCNRGSARFTKGDLDGTIADETKAIELDPKLTGAWVNRGSARLQKGDLDGALADEARATELDPGLAGAWLLHGSARIQKGELDGAIDDVTQAIKLDGKLAKAWLTRGNARLTRDPDGAIADETRAIELDPTLPSAWVIRANAHYKKDELDLAIADATRAIELDSRLPNAWLNRGMAHIKRNDLDTAIDDLTKAIELGPGLVGAWLNRGTARLLKGGDLGAAIADFTKAIELDPTNSMAFGNRANALRTKGDLDGAIADFEKFLELDPGDPQADAVRRDVAELKAKRGR
jgi:tetratricopeptide (TPR) repeat protein